MNLFDIPVEKLSSQGLQKNTNEIPKLLPKLKKILDDARAETASKIERAKMSGEDQVAEGLVQELNEFVKEKEARIAYLENRLEDINKRLSETRGNIFGALGGGGDLLGLLGMLGGGGAQKNTSNELLELEKRHTEQLMEIIRLLLANGIGPGGIPANIFGGLSQGQVDGLLSQARGSNENKSRLADALKDLMQPIKKRKRAPQASSESISDNRPAVDSPDDVSSSISEFEKEVEGYEKRIKSITRDGLIDDEEKEQIREMKRAFARFCLQFHKPGSDHTRGDDLDDRIQRIRKFLDGY